MHRLPRLFHKRARDLCCDDARDLASDFVDEGLDEAMSHRLREHMGVCPPCEAFMATFSKTVKFLRRMPQASAPPDARERILSRVRQEKG